MPPPWRTTSSAAASSSANATGLGNLYELLVQSSKDVAPNMDDDDIRLAIMDMMLEWCDTPTIETALLDPEAFPRINKVYLLMTRDKRKRQRLRLITNMDAAVFFNPRAIPGA